MTNLLQHALSASVILCALLAPALAGPAEDESGDPAPVRARLASEHTAVVPGRPSMLAVTFEIDEGWNLYWKNPGESGFPPRIDLQLPPGVTAGPVAWPVPERKILTGGILDYVHHDRLTLMFPLTLAADRTDLVGFSIAIRAGVAWLMCDAEGCVPGEAQVELLLPVAQIAVRTRDARLFDDARARLPRPPAPGELSARWNGSTLEIRVPATGGTPQSLEFFPEPVDDVDAAAIGLQQSGAAQGESLSIRFGPGGPALPGPLGVIRVRRGSAETLLEVPASAGP